MATKKTYTPVPEVPPEIQDRYQAVLEVLSGTSTVSEAARRLGMSRNHFQTVMHRGLEAMIVGLSPARAGRPAKPAREVELEAERDQLRRKTEQLEQRLDMTTRLMGIASELIKGSKPRSRTTKKRATAVTKADDESEGQPTSLREIAGQLETLGLPRGLVSCQLGVAPSTLRRWATGGAPPPVIRSIPPAEYAVEQAIADVRELRGLVGADALRHAHPELSRRQAARIKVQTVTTMERERRGACARVAVTVPGVVRGFDAMDRGCLGTPRYVLIAADGCIPYRTSVVATVRYDDAAVASVLEADFEEHGAPLVLRLDRAKAHRAPRTTAVLTSFGVLVLHGPPRYPRFYGQLERQNRDHSPWIHVGSNGDFDAFDRDLGAMKTALNVRWRRRALDWKTPLEVWQTRPAIDLDRAALRAEISARANNLRRSVRAAMITEDLANRLAIEQTLTRLGYLRIETRRPVLGDSEVVRRAI
jgi:transposase-like protein